MDIRRIFLLWFKWGFFANTALIASMLTSVLLIAFKMRTRLFFVVAGVMYLTNLILWLVMGGIWRFSELGRVAAGETLIREEDVSDALWRKQLEAAKEASGYQIASGAFIKVTIHIFIWLFTLGFLSFVLVASFACMCDPSVFLSNTDNNNFQRISLPKVKENDVNLLYYVFSNTGKSLQFRDANSTT